MKTVDRTQRRLPIHAHTGGEEGHVLDYVRTLYKRRMIALPVFLIVSGLTTKPVAHWLWIA